MSFELNLDTVVVPAHPKGFQSVFVEKLEWPNLKIGKSKLGCIKFIAVYQTSPISAITHYAKVAKYIPLEKNGRYRVKLEGLPIELKHVALSPSDVCAVQGPRYTTLEKIKTAANLTDAF